MIVTVKRLLNDELAVICSDSTKKQCMPQQNLPTNVCMYRTTLIEFIKYNATYPVVKWYSYCRKHYFKSSKMLFWVIFQNRKVLPLIFLMFCIAIWKMLISDIAYKLPINMYIHENKYVSNNEISVIQSQSKINNLCNKNTYAGRCLTSPNDGMFQSTLPPNNYMLYRRTVIFFSPCPVFFFFKLWKEGDA